MSSDETVSSRRWHIAIMERWSVCNKKEVVLEPQYRRNYEQSVIV